MSWYDELTQEQRAQQAAAAAANKSASQSIAANTQQGLNNSIASASAATQASNSVSKSPSLATSNSLTDLNKQIQNTPTSVDQSSLTNFDVGSYFNDTKKGLADLNGGKITQTDIAKFNQPSEAQKSYESNMDYGLGTLKQFTDPNSDIYKNTYRLLDSFDATAAASNLSQAMRIANNPYLTDSARNVANAELNRITQSNRATLVGDISEQINKQIFDAAETFTTKSIDAANYEQGKFRDSAKLAIDEMSNRISTLQIQGDISITEATLAYQKASDIINNKYKDLTNQFEKLSLLQDSEGLKIQQGSLNLQKDQYALQAKKIQSELFDLWSEYSISAIREAKNTAEANGEELTIEMVKNDPRLMNYISQEWATSGNEGAPSDAYIRSRIDAVKTDTQLSKEQEKILFNNYKRSGYSDEEAKAYVDWYRDALNGSARDENGNPYVPGADGKPIVTFIKQPDGTYKPVAGDGTKKEEKLTDGTYSTGSDGTLYKVENGEKIEVSTPSQIWGATAEQILKSGPESLQASEINQARKDSILNGEFTIEQIKNDPAKLKIANEVAPSWVMQATYTNPSGGRNDGYRFNDPPEMNVPFSYNGQVYMRTSEITEEQKRIGGDGHTGKVVIQQFTAVPINGGPSIVIKSKVIKSKVIKSNSNSNASEITEEPKRNRTHR